MTTTTATADTTPNLAGQVGRFVLYEGRLGHVMGSGLEQGSEPKRWVNLRVMSSLADDFARTLVGTKAVSDAYVGNGRYVRVPDLWDWPVVQHSEPVRKPSDGKTYTWKWTGERTLSARGQVFVRDGWRRVDYATCHDCYPTQREINGRRRVYDNVHPPTWQSADCGRCHPGGVCNGKGVCEGASGAMSA